MAIYITDEKYPLVSLSADEAKKYVGTTYPKRKENGEVDLTKSPLTKLLEQKEKEALEELAIKEGKSMEDMRIDGAGAKMDAFQRQLIARGLTGDKPLDAMLTAFWKPEEIGIFAEYVERAILLSENILAEDELAPSDLIASVKQIRGSKTATFPKIRLHGAKSAVPVVEGAGKPAYELVETDIPVNLEEFGFKLRLSHDFRVMETIDTASLVIQELAAENVLRAQVRAMLAICNGLTPGTAIDNMKQKTFTGTLTWKDVLRFLYRTGYPSRFPTILFTGAVADEGSEIDLDIVELLNLAILTDPIAVPGSATENKIPTIRGRALKFCVNANLDNVLYGLNKNLGFIMAENRDIMQNEWEHIADGNIDVYHWKTNWAFGLLTEGAVSKLVKAV